MASLGDLSFAFGEWLKTTPISGFAVWVSNTKASALVDSTMWVAILAQTAHIISVAVVFVCALMISLRILQQAERSRTLAQTVSRYTPWIWSALCVLLVTGLILIIGEPARELLNPAFWTKMALIVAPALGALALQGAVRRSAARGGVGPDGSLALRAGASGVLVILIAIIFLGRWIAYAPT